MKSKRLIIFEGPDGGGKSSASTALAALIGARRVHMSSFSGIKRGLARMYVDAMMPAILGLADVVMDRCWISEGPYSRVFRDGDDRVGYQQARLLERLAMRCQTTVVRALPPVNVVCDNFNRRRHEELLDDDAQLKQVYSWYADEWDSVLPTVDYDYTESPGAFEDLHLRLGAWHNCTQPHPLAWQTAGNLSAPVMVVGDSFVGHQEHEPLYQWPYGSLSGAGCSTWLVRGMVASEINEASLFWVNSDDSGFSEAVEQNKTRVKPMKIVALGPKASRSLNYLGAPHAEFPHPQLWKRENREEPYPLYDYLKEILGK